MRPRSGRPSSRPTSNRPRGASHWSLRGRPADPDARSPRALAVEFGVEVAAVRRGVAGLGLELDADDVGALGPHLDELDTSRPPEENHRTRTAGDRSGIACGDRHRPPRSWPRSGSAWGRGRSAGPPASLSSSAAPRSARGSGSGEAGRRCRAEGVVITWAERSSVMAPRASTVEPWLSSTGGGGGAKENWISAWNGVLSAVTVMIATSSGPFAAVRRSLKVASMTSFGRRPCAQQGTRGRPRYAPAVADPARQRGEDPRQRGEEDLPADDRKLDLAHAADLRGVVRQAHHQGIGCPAGPGTRPSAPRAGADRRAWPPGRG